MLCPPGEGAGEEDPLATMGPDEAGGDGGAAGADADAAAGGGGVVGGIRAVRKHPSPASRRASGRRASGGRRSAERANPRAAELLPLPPPLLLLP